MKNSPIFIIGESRSGKSLLGNFLATHCDCFWFSNYSNLLYLLPFLAALNRLYDLPCLGNILQRRLVKGKKLRPFPRPSEGDAIYSKYCALESHRWLTEHELTHRQADRLKQVIDLHRRFSGGQRFVNDESANVQRIRQISAIFPKAYFIHLIRDGRAVANEINQTSWWQQKKIWWFGDPPGSWQETGPEPILLCGLGWKYAIEAIRANSVGFQDHYLEVRYEDLVGQPANILTKVCQFCGLEEDRNFLRNIPAEIPSQNYRWRQELSARQRDVLQHHLAEILAELGYQ